MSGGNTVLFTSSAKRSVSCTKFWRIAPLGRILNTTPRPLMLFCMILDLVQYRSVKYYFWWCIIGNYIRQQGVLFTVTRETQYAKTKAKKLFWQFFKQNSSV